MIIGMGNALVDVLTNINDDQILNTLDFSRGTMTLVGDDTHVKIEELTKNAERKLVAGGSAANTVRGLAKLGINAGYIGKIGKDTIGDFLKQKFSEYGVTPHLINSDVTPTGRCMVMISPDGERTMATYLGAAVEMKDTEINQEMFNGYDYMHIEGYLVQDHVLIESAIAKAKQLGLKISLDMASYNIVEENLEFLRGLVSKYVDIVFANEDEAQSFTGKSAEAALDDISEMCEVAIVKVGARGSFIKSGDKKIQIDAVESTPIDTTGAGDLYATGFLYGFSKGYDLKKCGEIGSLVAGEVIKVVGPAIDDHVWDEIRKSL